MGSIDAARIKKGKKLPGHMGHVQVTIQNLEVISVDLENNVILIKGSVPGPKNSLVLVKTAVKTGDKASDPVELVVYEEATPEVEEIVEVADEQTPDGASEAEEAQIKAKEAQRIQKYIKDDTYLIALAIEGKMFSSEQLAEKIDSLAV